MNTGLSEHSANNTSIPPKALGLMSISDSEFEVIRKLTYDHFGINLTEQKRSLVVGRLQKYLRAMGFTNFQKYITFIKNDRSGRALADLVDRISTNHTFFFREKDHFDLFSEKILPQAVARLQQQNSKDLRIWSAGCSYGDESYTFIMLMMEYFGHRYGIWDAGILATDVSEKALEVARAGVYPDGRVSLVPPSLKHKYFRKTPDGYWQVEQRVKQEVVFRRFNLMNATFPFKKPFDLISCRNVMIYFDQPTRDRLVERFYDVTVPGGYLFIGHSESLPRADCPYEYVRPAVYRKGGA